MTHLSERVQRIKASPTLSIAARVIELQNEGQDIIGLSVGEPDFDTPDFIKKAGILAIEKGQTKYTHNDGTIELRKAIVEKFRSDQGIDYQLKQILVSSGAKQSLYNMMAAILNVGDEVLIPAPFWVSYVDMALLCDATPIVMPTSLSQRLKLTPHTLERHITPKTKLFIINSPCNPTGVAYTREELRDLADVLLKHPHILICCDDIYEKTLWQGEFVNILMIEPKLYERTVLINGVSKAYAMTGWRLGYAGGPPDIISAMSKIQSQSTSNASSISQAAALAALCGDNSCILPMVAAFKARHDYLIANLPKPYFSPLPADGAFYLFIEVKKAMAHLGSKDDIAFSKALLDKAQVAVVPGSAFGMEGFIRLSYATSMSHLEKAVGALARIFAVALQ